MTTMKAVQLHKYGEADVLVYEDVAVPVLQQGQVLIQVEAAGVNPVDWKTRRGMGVAGNLGSAPFPIMVGWDVSGVITETAEDVIEFAVGDAVYGMVNFPYRGVGYAEYAAAAAIELAAKPASISHEEAAALPLAALTAWQGLFEHGRLEAGQTVLIQAGAGGVGHLAVQLAKWKGARVITTASARNSGFLQELGADDVIDYTTTRIGDVLKEVDLVLEGVGGESLTHSLTVVRGGGTLISIVSHPTDAQKEAAHRAGVRLERPMVYANQDHLQMISALVTQGMIRPVIGAQFPLREASHAHHLSETGHMRGKIVLQVGE